MAEIIPSENATAGMVLANPILNRFGQILIPSGAMLEEKHINLIKTWGIKSIHIQSVETESEEPVSQEIVDLSTNKLKSRMLWQPKSALEMDMFQIAIKRLVKQTLKNRGDK